MVVAIAGRRIDPPGAGEPRFPESAMEGVLNGLMAAFAESGARAVVSAAACGADIIALEAAGRMGLRRRVVLPSDPRSFRDSSVVDRPGDWGERYDRIIAEVAAANDLVIRAHPQAEGDAAYLQANVDILDEARLLADELGLPLSALVVWNQVSRGASDVTAHFLALARERGLPVQRSPLSDLNLIKVSQH
jgi:hypothetical protein